MDMNAFGEVLSIGIGIKYSNLFKFTFFFRAKIEFTNINLRKRHFISYL